MASESIQTTSKKLFSKTIKGFGCYLFIYLSIYLFIYLYIYLFIYLFIYSFIIYYLFKVDLHLTYKKANKLT